MTSTSSVRPVARLSRAALASTLPAASATEPPIRIVHLGLGAFHRAHQAWYTSAARDGRDWGIAAFTGRSPDAAELLAPQDGLYTLLVRSEHGDTASVIPNLVAAIDGADVRRLAALMAAPATAIVTLTITEAGYRLTPANDVDLDDPVTMSDLALLRRGLRRPAEGLLAGPSSALGRLLLGLMARRAADAGPLAIVPCDNIPDNGRLVRRGLITLARHVDAQLAEWIDSNISFVSTSVDRITPRTTKADIATACRLTGLLDEAPVVTEPFTDWILCGEFPAGRPLWETAGARFVTEIEPFERRKLWFLNGAHSLLAYAGLLAGHRTVAEAIGDVRLRASVSELWNEARAHLPAGLLGLDEYAAALLERFENRRIEHSLEQIAADGVTKLRVRIAPVASAERAAGRMPEACARAFGAWIALTMRGAMPDSQADAIRAVLEEERDPVHGLIALVDRALADDDAFVARVRSATEP